MSPQAQEKLFPTRGGEQPETTHSRTSSVSPTRTTRFDGFTLSRENPLANERRQRPSLHLGDRSGPVSIDSELNAVPGSPSSIRSHAMSLNLSSAATTTDIAFTALQYLPVPILVLNSLKTTVFANESFAKLVAEDSQVNQNDCRRLSETIIGQTLGQIGQ